MRNNKEDRNLFWDNIDFLSVILGSIIIGTLLFAMYLDSLV